MLVINKKIAITNHARDRMSERVGNEKSKYRGSGFKNKSVDEKIKFHLSHLLGQLAYLKGAEENVFHLFTKGYIEYVLIDKPDCILVKTIIFHGRFKAEKRIEKLTSR